MRYSGPKLRSSCRRRRRRRYRFAPGARAPRGMHGGDFHRPGDGRGADIQRAAKNERETQNVVDLVRIVASTGRHDGVVARGLASSGKISGVGLASARIRGFAAIFSTMSRVSTPPADRPRNTSALPMISSRVRAAVGRAKRAFSGSISSLRPSKTTPARSDSQMFSRLSPDRAAVRRRPTPQHRRRSPPVSRRRYFCRRREAVEHCRADR